MGPEATVAPLRQHVRYRAGVGPARAGRLGQMGIETVLDLLLHLPREYEERGEVVPVASVREGERAVVCGTIEGVHAPARGRGRGLVRARLNDGTGTLDLVWFQQPWRARSLPAGRVVRVCGCVTSFGGRRQMANPEIAPEGAPSAPATGCVPVYATVEGLPQGWLRRVIADALPAARAARDWMPPALLAVHRLPALGTALRLAHRPGTRSDAARARLRLVWGESLLFHLARLRRRQAAGRDRTWPVPVPDAVDRRIRVRLGVRPTGAQERAIAVLRADLARPTPMRRILMGDVGSGKTAVALYAILATVAGGGQAALLVPTEILAEQHALTIRDRLAGSRVRVEILTASRPRAEREAVRRALAAGDVGLVVGTHALLSPAVRFRRLLLAVIDEQHRFGVAQRRTLRAKGAPPHLLVMTATPIPRTLALACFGDLDAVVLDEMPPGRPPVRTRRARPSERPAVYAALAREVSLGRQAYVVAPRLREEGGAGEGEADVQAAERLARTLRAGALARARVGLIHGRMPAARKEEAMRSFRDGRLDVLVGTTVVEVGLDVPNASRIVIEDAHRLGLAQLHQLRGRVGRGPHPSECVLVGDPPTPEGEARLDALVRLRDGARIAEEDLRLRGPGALLGVRQSGLPELRWTDLVADREPFVAAGREAARILARDPALSSPGHARLRGALAAFLRRRLAPVDA